MPQDLYKLFKLSRWLVLGLVLLIPLKISAQTGEENVGLSVVPAIIEQPLTPGVSTTISIQVTNISDIPLAVRVGARPLAPLDPLTDESERSRYDASRWLTPLTPELVLETGETRAVQFTALPNPQAGPGGHYALLVFRVISPEPESASINALVNPEITSIILLTLPGAIEESAKLELIKPQWYWTPQQELSLNLTNTGNVHILPQSQFVITNLAGETLTTIATASRLVLPGTVSQFKADWQPQSWGLYRLRAETSFGTPLTLLSSDRYLLIVWPPIWVQSVAVGLLVALALVTRQSLRLLRQKIRRPRRFARDSSDQPAKLNAIKMDEISNQPGTRDISHKKR